MLKRHFNLLKRGKTYMYMYEDWMKSKGTTELLTSKACEGGPWLCKLLVFNSFVGCISPGSYGLLIIAFSHKSFFFPQKNWQGKWVLRNNIVRNVQYFVHFFLALTVTWLFDFYGVLLVGNPYHIGVHTVDISRRKAVVSNTKWDSLGRLGGYHWWIFFFECN